MRRKGENDYGKSHPDFVARIFYPHHRCHPGDAGLTLKGVKEQRANDAAPIVTAEAKVKAKRIAVHHSAHQQSMNGVPLMAKSHHTTYYATFGLEGDRRLELQVSQGQFQQLTEGEQGKLTYQRKRFHRFEGENA